MQDLLNKTGRSVLMVTILTFSIGTVVWLLAYGNEHNSLHLSALSWSFTMIGTTLVGLGVGVALQTLKGVGQ